MKNYDTIFILFVADFNLNKKDLEEIDELAKLMLDPNKNFKQLCTIWNNESKYRIMIGGTIN